MGASTSCWCAAQHSIAWPAAAIRWWRSYENRGDSKFIDVSAKAGLTAHGWGMGVTVADYDNDGSPDFLVTGFGRNFLFHNEGQDPFANRP